jgi:copper chaperone
MTDKVFTVPDISCGHCKSTIEGALKSVKQVRYVDVNVDKKTVRVSFDPPDAIAEIVRAIEDQGYAVQKD